MIKISLSEKPTSNLQVATASVLPFFDNAEAGTTAADPLFASNHFSKKPLAVNRQFRDAHLEVYVGAPKAQNPQGWKEWGGTLSRIDLPGQNSLNLDKLELAEIEAVLIGLALGSFRYTELKTDSKSAATVDQEWLLTVKPELISAISKFLPTLAILERQVTLARQLSSTPANLLSPANLADTASKVAKSVGISVEVWDEGRLKTERCGALLAVGAGSSQPPRLVKLKYGTGQPDLAIIGKGITFDSGGLSLKPADSMLGMKYDMSGAAIALGAIAAIAELKLEVCVEAILCIAENLPGPMATRPGDVITTRAGLSVEVTNTDAEGRLVLADGISVALESNPKHIVDIATLTGAATIALGNRYAGLMGTGQTIELIKTAAESALELFWHMPLPEDASQALESQIADMVNAKVGYRAGGMLVGGQFLNKFVNQSSERNWAHLDIANVANNDGKPYAEVPVGPTGYGLRTLVELARKLAAAQ